MLTGGGARAGLTDHLLHSPRLLDDPAGARSRLERLGVSLQLFYNQFLSWKPAGGGADPRGVLGDSGSYDLFARVDARELVGWPGLDVLLHVKGQYDRNINDAVGALSEPIDDADFDEPIYVDELWLQQSLFGDRLRLRLGLLEQQTIFDRNALANTEDRQFLTTFLDNNPLVPLPNALGAGLIAAPLPWLELAVGVVDADNVPRKPGFDTLFDGADSLSEFLELDFSVRIPGTRPLPGSYRLGMFRDGRPREDWAQPLPQGGFASERGHLGAYASFDQVVFWERDEGLEGLALFTRFGYADPDVNPIAWFWSAGLQYVGPVPGRRADVLGVGAYQAIGSHVYRDAANPAFHDETGIEIYYAVAVLPWLAITPDFQYIVDPGGEGTDDAIVCTLRFRVGF